MSQKGVLLNILTRDGCKRTLPSACISVFSVISGYAVYESLPEAILNYLAFLM